MSDWIDLAEPHSADAPSFARVVDILGGPEVLRCTVRSPLDVHELLLRGLPGAALTHLVGTLALLRDPDSLEKAVGISLRTFQRRKGHPAMRLSHEQSGRTWKFAEMIAKATAVLGSLAEAEQWLERPAIGLGQRRPIDLMATAVGIDMVDTYLERIAYGVYA
jgi:putative toxin-antitoxin system antitoxin component (TIGR02293 family)